MNTVRTMIELTEEQARAFVDAWDGNTQAPANVYHAACIAIADALAEVLPRPLNVGARVRFGNEIGAMTYEVCAIDGTAAWLKHYDGRHSTALLADLVRAS